MNRTNDTTGPPAAATVVVMDVDGVVSPVHGRTDWGDDVRAGNVFGPVLVSPALCARLDVLGSRPGVECCWLTSWTPGMRAAMDPFPGSGWRVVADGGSRGQISRRRWWKLIALATWLDQYPEVERVAWCDDHLRPPARRSMVLRELESRHLSMLLLAPSTAVGLTMEQMSELETWASAPPQDH